MRQAKNPSHSIYTFLVMIVFVLGVVPMVIVVTSCSKLKPASYEDVSHFSKVFNRSKFFRLYLPSGYEESGQRYPVIYFFHGWGGRYKSDDNAKLAYDKIRVLVDKYQAILVMWDGNVDENEPRPYNIGNHADIRYNVQMKDYFAELVQHIDSAYKTMADKNHRGIIGFSMGGFMSYFLAGKFPDMIGAATAMTGSPEFFVGYPEHHTLYPLRFTFDNLREVKLRFHNSTADELTYLNTEVKQGAEWNGGLSWEYWQFEGGHVVDLPGKTDVFEKAMRFTSDAFVNPMKHKSHWSHYDLYPEFNIYDYHVKRTGQESGFTQLHNVSRQGFNVATHQWLPDGPPFAKCNVEITTAPLYKKSAPFKLVKYDKQTHGLTHDVIQSDVEGRIRLLFDDHGYEIGVYQEHDRPEFVCAGYSVGKGSKYLRNGDNSLKLILLNRAGEPEDVKKMSVSLSSTDSSIVFKNKTMGLEVSSTQQRLLSTPAFELSCLKNPPHNGAPAWARLQVGIDMDSAHFEDEIIVPIFYDAPPLNDLLIDDGRAVNDSSKTHGKGSGDGIINPGENIMVYHRGHRLRLYTDDPYVIGDEEVLVDEVLPAKWPDGFTLSSVISIDKNCPDGHIIEGLANFETKGFMPIERKVSWGRVKLKVVK
ncbi:MAG TPA: alpha/beta hydrolase-fold protein [Chryseolinea sp.]|nr:alpha/beta hydrolase-fold protein [Chryseolinea sp.]